jgi:hypothetical protein
MKRRPIAILCNGPSLARAPLNRIPCETIGLNRSWKLTRSSYHFMVDADQWNEYELETGLKASTLPRLHTPLAGPGESRFELVHVSEPKFSMLPFHAAYLYGLTVAYVALQFAVWWKRNPIYFLGLDLWDEMPPRLSNADKYRWQVRLLQKEAQQREAFGFARGFLDALGYQVFNVCDDGKTHVRAFPVVTFEQAWPEAKIEQPSTRNGLLREKSSPVT